MFTSLRIPVTFLVTGVCWALFSNPLITFFARHLTPSAQDSFRGLNDLAFVLIITIVLYVKIKKQQYLLTRSEEEYRQLFESNPNPLWIYNTETLRFVKINNAALEKYAYTEKKLLKMTIDSIYPAGAHEKINDYIFEHKSGLRLAGMCKHLKSTGETFDVSIISYPVLFNNQHCNLVMATDITELLEKERKLQDAHRKIKNSNKALLEIAWSHSHELRKPLCSILGLLPLLKETEDEQERNEFIELMEVCSAELDQVLRENSEKVTEMDMQEVVLEAGF
jgi:PAS domain S-box-containing protein